MPRRIRRRVGQRVDAHRGCVHRPASGDTPCGVFVVRHQRPRIVEYRAFIYLQRIGPDQGDHRCLRVREGGGAVWIRPGNRLCLVVKPVPVRICF